MRSFLRIAALLGFLLVPLISNAADEGTQSHELKIGVSFPLTGDLAVYGEPQKNGAVLAAEEINRESSLKVRLIIEDNAFNPAKQSMVVKKFIDIDKVDVILTSWTPMTIPVSSVIQEAKTPTFSWMVFRSTSELRYLFRIYNDFEKSTCALIQHACRDGVKRAAYLTAESAEFVSIDKGAQEEAVKCGLTLTGINKYDLNTNDFRPILTKIKAGHPEGLIIGLFPQHVPAFLKQASELGMDSLRLYDTACGATDPLISKGYENVIDKMNTTGAWYTLDPAQPSAKKFLEAYRERFHAEAPPYAAYEYQVTKLYHTTFTRCVPAKSLELRECIANSLLSTQQFTGPAGTGKMDKFGNFELPISILRRENGRFVYEEGN